MQPLTRVFQKQLERVGVRVRGVRTGAALDRQSLLKNAVTCGASGVMAALP